MPDMLFCKLKYQVTFDFVVPPSGGLTSNLSTIGRSLQSSLFDPEYTVGGHQPMYYDELGYFYRKYKVFGIKYRYTFINIDGTKPICWVVQPTNTDTLDNNFQAICEEPGHKKRWSTGVYSNRPVVIKGYAGVAKTYGVPKGDVRRDAYYEGDWNTNPTRVMYIHGYSHSTDSSPTNAQVRIEAIYYCLLYKKVDVGPS